MADIEQYIVTFSKGEDEIGESVCQKYFFNLYWHKSFPEFCVISGLSRANHNSSPLSKLVSIYISETVINTKSYTKHRQGDSFSLRYSIICRVFNLKRPIIRWRDPCISSKVSHPRATRELVHIQFSISSHWNKIVSCYEIHNSSYPHCSTE